ncbi:MAG: hypothetical protein ABJC66_17235 [Gammaproteobacteria bacterium]
MEVTWHSAAARLRGGDAWDHKIRQKIRDCTLFIPLKRSINSLRPNDAGSTAVH